ncbi:lysine N(6)-hydroxylase/L-ornithine N(5)-oxygenase family protein [Pseudalkalibacillus caeni]|uniref:L-lysine N6-monooxygenase MbtG n=1 Tax=Exobacillus caeni TaxID=2574798 RepID=A0A5R9EZT3_9BACL|nr:lysine N(6)-hydroxylase/L-ornithine N(5)-oxygenase family protein [Pseudalkalibacillus caeni]TLS35969.1 lysine 6-monooxygenase [Pseudalkalibacillus caeni]
MGNRNELVDLIGVGIGPFNLSLAALLEDVPEIDAVFFEQKSQFDWHPGMLIEGTKLQVPFLADLVTMANPKSQYSFLNYLTEHDRMYAFYFLQRLDMPRREYNDYCQWVAGQLDSCKFGKTVVNVKHIEAEEPYFEVEVYDSETESVEKIKGKNMVLGTGSTPGMPSSFRGMPEDDVFHTADFRNHQKRCREAKSITVVGSGQSAAEVFRELLKEQRDHHYRLDWLTRSSGFLSMEESKLNLEHFSPDYVNYFYQLPQEKKDEIFATQDLLYKGISMHTITDIYNLLYEMSVGGETLDVGLQTLTEVNEIKKEGNTYKLKCEQREQEKEFTHESEVVIVGTGYRPNIPEFILSLESFLQWDEHGRYKVGPDYRLKQSSATPNEVYVHSGISHSHGVGSTNLGLAVHRNKVIINHLTGRPVYRISEQNVFQNFEV